MTPLYDHAMRYVGIQELAGNAHHPLIQWWLSLCGMGNDAPDETAWCSAFVNGMAWDLRLPRSKSAAARSWLNVGVAIPPPRAQVGDVVIFRRGPSPQPGPEVIQAPGHVGLWAGVDADRVLVLGGNQTDGVCIAPYPYSAVLGVRRIA